MRMLGWKVKECPARETMPVTFIQKFALARENLHQGAAPVGMGREFLPRIKMERYNAQVGRVDHGAAHDSRGRSLRSLEDIQGLRAIGR